MGCSPLMWSCALLSFHDRVKFSNYWIPTEQLHTASSGLPGTDIGRRHRGCMHVQLLLVIKVPSKRGRKFKCSLKYSKVMRCSHKILSKSSKNLMRLIDFLFYAMAEWKVLNLDIARLVFNLILHQEMNRF